MKSALVLTFLLTVTTAFAAECTYDADCPVGSDCIKRDGAIVGTCEHSATYNAENVSRPTEFETELRENRENRCSFDSECGLGFTCVKEIGDIHGICEEEIIAPEEQEEETET